MDPSPQPSLLDLAQVIAAAGRAHRDADGGPPRAMDELGRQAEEAARLLNARLQRGLRGTLASRRVHGEERLERLAHEAFTVLWRRLWTGNLHEHVIDIGAFAMGIARNLARRERAAVGSELPENLASGEPSDEDLIAHGALMRALRACIDQLPERLRSVIEAVLQGRQQKDVAAELARDPSAVARRKQDALKRLQHCLSNKGFAAVDAELIERVRGRAEARLEDGDMGDTRDIDDLLRDLAESEAMDDPLARPGPSPDCLTFERCARIGSAETRPTPVEAEHLERCTDCRERVRHLSSAPGAVPTVPSVPALPTGHRPARGRRLRLVAFAVLAGAAALALAVLWPRAGRPDVAVEIALAPTPEGLFQVSRGVAEAEEFYVGVRLAEAGHVRLLFLYDRGVVFSQALDPDGSSSLLAKAGDSKGFGAYQRRWTKGGEEYSVERVLVVVTPTQRTDEAVNAALLRLGPLGSIDAPSVDAFAAALAVELAGSVSWRSLAD